MSSQMMASASCCEWFLQSMKTSRPTQISSWVKEALPESLGPWNLHRSLRSSILTGPIKQASNSEKQRKDVYPVWLAGKGTKYKGVF